MRILSPMFVAHYYGRLLNIHPSPAAKNIRVAYPRQALENGDESTVPVHFQTDELDGGPVILRAKVPVFDDSEDDITARVQTQEHAIYPLVISWFAQGRSKMRDNAARLTGVVCRRRRYASDE